MEVSGAFMLPLHTCEIVVRNAVAEAIALRHGPHWPWQQSFRLSLPGNTTGFNGREELRRIAGGCTSTATVVAGLRFAFWQQMFTQRFDRPLWAGTISSVLPGTKDKAHHVRARLHADLDRIRHLRNRIAHHEPIFSRDLAEDMATLARVVHLRCPRVCQWMEDRQSVTALLRRRPV